MSAPLGRRLLASGAVRPSEIEAALYRHLTTGTPFVRALLELGHISEETLEQEFARSMLPLLKTVIPLPAIMDELPRMLCRTLLAVPVRRDPRTGTVDIATVDPYDAHVPKEFAYHLKGEIRLLRGPLALVEEALARIDKGEYSSSVILRKSARPPSRRPPPPELRPSERPIPLVRRAHRPDAVQVLPVREVGAPTPPAHDVRADERADRDRPARLSSPRLPAAPAVPSFSGSHSKPARPRQSSSPKRPSAPPKISRGRPSAPPDTSRGPFSPKAPVAPFADISGILEAMDTATSRDEVVDCLIVGMNTVARRVGVFAVKKGRFCGWACNADLGDAAAFRAIDIPVDAATVFATAAATGSYLGPLPRTAAHRSLLQFIKDPSHEVTASLIRVAGRPAVVLFADKLGDTLTATRRAEELGQRASRAFSRILADAKAGRGGG